MASVPQLDDPRYEGILQLVGCLIDGGNRILDAGFHLSDVGWTCKLALPIDFALIRETFAVEDAEQLVLNDWLDEVWDHNTWASIEGPVYSLRAGELPSGERTTRLFPIQSGFAGDSAVVPQLFTFDEDPVHIRSLVSVA